MKIHSDFTVSSWGVWVLSDETTSTPPNWKARTCRAGLRKLSDLFSKISHVDLNLEWPRRPLINVVWAHTEQQERFFFFLMNVRRSRSSSMDQLLSTRTMLADTTSILNEYIFKYNFCDCSFIFVHSGELYNQAELSSRSLMPVRTGVWIKMFLLCVAFLSLYLHAFYASPTPIHSYCHSIWLGTASDASYLF